MPTQPSVPPGKKTKGKTLKQKASRLGSVLISQSAREGYLASVDQGVISLANFIATLILARNVSPTELGVYGVGFTSLRLIRSIQEGLTIQPLNTFGAVMDESPFRRYATSTSLIQLVLGILSAAVVALVGWWLTALGNDVAGPTLFSLWFSFLWWQYQEYIRRMLYTRGRVPSAVFNTILANAVRLGLMVYWTNQGTLTGIDGLNAIAWGSLVALIPGLWQTRKYFSRTFDPILATFQKNWKFGKWIMGGVLANWTTVEFYPVLTAGMVSFAAAGAYRALQNLVAPIHMLLRAIDTFLTPRASKIYYETGMGGLTYILKMTYIFSGIPTLGILLVTVLYAPQLLHLLYGDTYLEYANAMPLMALFYALLFSYYPLQSALKAIHLSRPIFVANGVAIAVMFTFGLWTILQWGLYGTLIGQITNSLIVALILWGTWFRVRKSQTMEVQPGKT